MAGMADPGTIREKPFRVRQYTSTPQRSTRSIHVAKALGQGSLRGQGSIRGHGAQRDVSINWLVWLKVTHVITRLWRMRWVMIHVVEKHIQRGVVRQILGEARAFCQIPFRQILGPFHGHASGPAGVRQILYSGLPEGSRTSDTVIDYSTLVNNKTTQNGKYSIRNMTSTSCKRRVSSIAEIK